MIDIHSHILPGIDDGSFNRSMSIEMAKIAVSDGVETMICTPHIYYGVYENSFTSISQAVEAFQALLNEYSIPLKLKVGADIHIVYNIVDLLKSGKIPTLAGSRYFLLELTQLQKPLKLSETCDFIIKNDFIPIITHPERFKWLRQHYLTMKEIAEKGCLIQITAGSIMGNFGKDAQQLSEKLLDDGYVDVVASDTHNTDSRSPILSHARDIISRRLGEGEANAMFLTRPAAILHNQPVLRSELIKNPMSDGKHYRRTGQSWFRPFGRGIKLS